MGTRARRLLLIATLGCTGCALVIGLGDEPEPAGAADSGPDGAAVDGASSDDGRVGDGGVDAGPGTLDPDFGDGGIAFVPPRFPGATGTLFGIAASSDIIYATGNAETVSGDPALESQIVKLDSKGAFDNGFGSSSNGVASLSVSNLMMFRVAVDVDGGALAAGVAPGPTAFVLNASATGQFPAGASKTIASNGSSAYAAVVSGGERFVAGSDLAGGPVPRVWKLDPSNTPIAAFSGLTTGDGGTPATFAFGTAIDLRVEADSIFLAVDGPIVAAPAALTVVKLKRSDGTNGAGFGTSGVFTTPRAADHLSVRALALAPEAIYVAGTVTKDGSNQRDIVIDAVKRDGSALVSAFGNDGEVRIDIATSDDIANDLAIDSQGRFVIVGSATYGEFGIRPCLLRLLPSGARDPAFGNDGILFLPGQGAINGVALQPDGRILVSGFLRADASGIYRGFVARVRP